MKPVKAPYATRQMLVCTHHRDPATGKASCAVNGGVALKDHLKKTVKERGWKGDVVVTQTGCMDVCPTHGVAVGFHPDATFFVAEPDEAEALLEHLHRRDA
jgi:predicted metal-binding protein